MSNTTKQNVDTKSNGQANEYPPKCKVSLWKANKNGNGNAAILEYSSKSNCGFLTMMPQGSGERKFDDTRKATAKLNENDIGEILAVIRGRKEGLGRLNDQKKWSGLYHENQSGNAVITLNKGDYGYILGLSVNKNGQSTRFNVGVSDGEMEQLRVFFEYALLEIIKNQ